MKLPLETIAAIHLESAADGMDCAADHLLDLKTKEARQHAKEMIGAAKMARQWARELRRSAEEAK